MTTEAEQGSSLVEALVATLVLSSGILTMAQLLSIATATNFAARRSTVAMILAEQKLEELRTLPWETLQPSPPSTLEQNTDGYVDYVGIYTRRWSLAPASAMPDASFVIHVLVTTSHDRFARDGVSRPRGHARVLTVRARKTKW